MVESNEVAAGHPDMDYAEHTATYAFFLKLIKYVVAVVVLILLFLAYMWG